MSSGQILSKLNEKNVNTAQASASVVKSAIIGFIGAGVQHYIRVPNVTGYAQYTIDGALGAISSTSMNKVSTDLEKMTKKTVRVDGEELIGPEPSKEGEEQDVKTRWRVASAAASVAFGAAAGAAAEYGLNAVNPHHPFWNKATAITAAALAKDISSKLINTSMDKYARPCMRMTPTVGDK